MIKIVAVEIVQSMLLRARSHVHVDEPVVECGEYLRHHVRHKMLAHLAARIGQAIGKFFGPGKKQQTSIVVNEGSENHNFRFNRVVGAVGAVIRDAGCAPAVVGVHAITHRAGD